MISCSNMKLKYTTPRDIEKIIKSLKSKNSHGYDGIPIVTVWTGLSLFGETRVHKINKIVRLHEFI
jgi:hypothetical protein